MSWLIEGEMGFILLRILMCVYMYFHLTRCPVKLLINEYELLRFQSRTLARYTGIYVISREIEKVSLHTGSNKRKCSNQACLLLILHRPALDPTLQSQVLQTCSPRRIERIRSLCVSYRYPHLAANARHTVLVPALSAYSSVEVRSCKLTCVHRRLSS
jgi:hypothetical protein